MKKWDIINHIIQKRGYTTYLEIGYGKGNNFKRINIEHKVSVDPVGKPTYKMTSDDFFAQNTETFDIIFIDGLHTYQQSLSDFWEAVFVLNEGGTIVMHDCLPFTEEMQLPEPIAGRPWTGDVWKAIAILRESNVAFDIKVVDTDYGCAVIQEGENIPFKVEINFSYNFYLANRDELLNVVSPEKWLEEYV